MFLIGLIVPFTVLGIIEFFVIIPLAVVFVVNLIGFVVLFDKSNNEKIMLWFLPVFIIAQIVSVYVVNESQRFRSNNIIEELEMQKKQTGSYPLQSEYIFGIEYFLIDEGKNFVIKYSRGFLVTEKYYSEQKKWRSCSWND